MGHFLLTGAFSGLGLALGVELGSRGMKVAGMGRSLESRDPAILSTFSTVHEVDFAHPSSTHIESVISELVTIHPSVQLIINAAQIDPLGSLGSLDNSDIEQSIAVNITTPLLIINSFLYFTHSNNRIFIIGSGAAKHTIEGWDLYSIGKSTLLRSMDFINASSPGTVTWLEPGVIDTAMQARLKSSSWGLETGKLPSPAEAARKLAEQIVAVTN
jgi:benzil reductase ((S)-benzoin forming)